MDDNTEQQNTTLEDPEQVVKDQETSFLKQLDNTAKQTSIELKLRVDDLRSEANEVYDKAQEFAERHLKKVETLITRIAYTTVALIVYFTHASALCYLSMSINVNNGLGGVRLSGPPFKPPRLSINKCPEEDFSKGFFEGIRNSLNVFGFPYKNMNSCDNFAMLKESFLNVRLSRWISSTIAFSYSSGRHYLNYIFSFFSDPISAFWILPIFVPIILMLTLFFAPITTIFGGLLLNSEILPSNFFGIFAVNPLGYLLTAIAFGAGMMSLPLINTFAMVASALFFFVIFPYILNDKFIFPKDNKLKTPYSGFEFIWGNMMYRWETILLAWLIAVANITKQTLDTKEDSKAKIITVVGTVAKVRFNSGSEVFVKTKELSIDPDGYLVVNSRVEINTNPFGTNKLIGVIRKIDRIHGEFVYTIFIEHKDKPDETLKAVKHKNITPIVSDKNKKKLRNNTLVIVNSKSSAGSIASKYIYMIALCWLIWIIFKQKASYVVLSVISFILNFTLDNQVTISLIILLGVGLYYGIMYKDDVDVVAGDLVDKANKMNEKNSDINEGDGTTKEDN